MTAQYDDDDDDDDEDDDNSVLQCINLIKDGDVATYITEKHNRLTSTWCIWLSMYCKGN